MKCLTDAAKGGEIGAMLELAKFFRSEPQPQSEGESDVGDGENKEKNHQLAAQLPNYEMSVMWLQTLLARTVCDAMRVCVLV